MFDVDTHRGAERIGCESAGVSSSNWSQRGLTPLVVLHICGLLFSHSTKWLSHCRSGHHSGSPIFDLEIRVNPVESRVVSDWWGL